MKFTKQGNKLIIEAEIPEIDEEGRCDLLCPFFDHACFLGLDTKLVNDPWGIVAPGPKCPRYKGGEDE